VTPGDSSPAVQGARPSALPVPLFAGFAVAAIGGPLALPSILPGVAGDAISSAGLVVLLALLLFLAPLGIWLSFSRKVVSPGGLSAFVDAAAGRRTAVAHGWIWAFSYFLYLPFTITFVVYDVLAPVFPGIEPYRGALELLLPVAVVGAVLVPLRWCLAGLGVLAAAQLVLLVVLAAVTLSHTGGVHGSFRVREGDETARAAAGVALLFLCLSLPLYLGAEVRGGSRTVRRWVAAAFAIVGVAFLLAAAPLALVPDKLLDAAVPAAAIAQAYSGRGLAVAVGLLTAASALALIVAEYLALARLIHWLHGPPVKAVLLWIAVPFLALDAISLLSPDRFYDDLLKPSLFALFLSQLIVFAVYPRFRRSGTAIFAAAVASGLAFWGLYTLVAGTSST
jgi:hypothetical protein